MSSCEDIQNLINHLILLIESLLTYSKPRFKALYLIWSKGISLPSIRSLQKNPIKNSFTFPKTTDFSAGNLSINKMKR